MLRLFTLSLIAGILAGNCAAVIHAQTPAPIMTPTAAVGELSDAERLDLLAQRFVEHMTPEERIGQLFVITVRGADIRLDSDIVQLIHNQKIGGVVLSPRNGNFSNERGVDTPRQIARLTNQLQALAYGVLLPSENALQPVPLAPWPPQGDFVFLPDSTQIAPVNLPLLIGVTQTGDDLPATALRRGFTPLPSPMALGASWNREQVKSVGSVVGRELRAVGFNLLLGPSLDVFRPGNLEKVNTLGLYSFGGNPYWVAQLGRAYIEGVHAGGGGRVATVASSFPGQGAADRVPSEEVATIQASQTELRQNALPPFLAVTRQPSSVIDPAGDPGATDVLMTSHMRYIGLQGGDGRGRPLSLAPELRTVLRQEGIAEWQSRGGVMMSGPLGVQALRRYFETTNPENFRRVAQDALVAGNDLLFLADLSLDNAWESQFANIIDTVTTFHALYAQDRDFAALVDSAAQRIVRLKLGIYRDLIDPVAWATGVYEDSTAAPIVPLSNVLVTDTDLGVLTSEDRVAAEQQMGQIARSAVTLLYPDPSTQTAPIPPPFSATDKILIFTDFRLQRECLTCEPEPSVGPDAVARIIERLYGSQSTGVIDPNNIVSKTFVELTALLDSLDQAALAATLTPQPPVDLSATASEQMTVTEEANATPAVQTTPSSLLLPTPTPTPAETATPSPTVTPTTLPVTAPTLSAPMTPAAPVGLDEIEAATMLAGNDLNSRTLAMIEAADWIIFVMLDVAPESAPMSTAVKRLLGDYPDLIKGQKTVVFALHAPYYLDATEMSKLTGYFGVYSKTPPFLESAVHALFRRYPPIGAPPVDVPGTRFASLGERLQPNPAVQIPLAAEESDGDLITRTGDDPPAGERPSVEVGSLLRLRAGPITDLNGNPVPDGVPVSFELRYEGEETALMVEPAASRNGVAVREVTPDRSGVLRINARAGRASSDGGVSVVVLPPATSPSESSAEAAPASANQPEEPTLVRTPAPDRVNLLTLSLALFTMVIVLSLLLIVQVRVLPRPLLVHNLLWAVIFGLAGYILYGIGLFPGGAWLRNNVGMLSIPVVVFIPMLLPLLWLQLRSEERSL